MDVDGRRHIGACFAVQPKQRIDVIDGVSQRPHANAVCRSRGRRNRTGSSLVDRARDLEPPRDQKASAVGVVRRRLEHVFAGRSQPELDLRVQPVAEPASPVRLLNPNPEPTGGGRVGARRRPRDDSAAELGDEPPVVGGVWRSSSARNDASVAIWSGRSHVPSCTIAAASEGDRRANRLRHPPIVDSAAMTFALRRRSELSRRLFERSICCPCANRARSSWSSAAR